MYFRSMAWLFEKNTILIDDYIQDGTSLTMPISTKVGSFKVRSRLVYYKNSYNMNRCNTSPTTAKGYNASKP